MSLLRFSTRLVSGAAALAALEGAASAQLNIVSNLPGTFVDISTTGTPLSLTDDGEVDITTTVGNALLPAGTVRVGSNGAVRFRGTGNELAFTNAAIPNAGACCPSGTTSTPTRAPPARSSGKRSPVR